jgi:carbon monoxide dehydrogenase subunit G
MMIVVERTFTVSAAPGPVLAYLKDFGNAVHWDPAAQAITRADAGPLAPGANWHHVRKIMGVTAELTYTLIEATADRLVLHGRSEGATSLDTVTVRPVPEGTEVHYRVELEMHGLAKLATPVIKVEFEKLGTESAAGLRQALDRLAPPTWHPTVLPPPAPA